MAQPKQNNQNIPPESEELEDVEEIVESDGEPHLAENLTNDWQEEMVDEYGEYSDNTLEPDEVLYGEDESDFDYEYYDNEDEWDISQDDMND